MDFKGWLYKISLILSKYPHPSFTKHVMTAHFLVSLLLAFEKVNLESYLRQYFMNIKKAAFVG